MKNIQLESHTEGSVEELDLLRMQLQREITCLERQVDRFHYLDGDSDPVAYDTYREMIACRRRMLAELTD